VSKIEYPEQIILIPGGININENGESNHLINKVKQIWMLWASIWGLSNRLKEGSPHKVNVYKN